ncbi:hypothetical protein EON64_20240 [archaeon]|nr:MAG: hypothetical protein EON64_20240 [archaeon]
MSFIVATLLLALDEYSAFVCFCNMLCKRVSRDFMGLRRESVEAYVLCFDHYFKKVLAS